MFSQQAASVEQSYWSGDISLESLQQFYAQLEHGYNNESDDRYHFIVVIPVADRPEQLDSCLASIKTLCDTFQYGGFDTHYKKVSVLIADDSDSPQHIEKTQQVAKYWHDNGLKTEYFGQQEQWQLIKTLVDKPQYESMIGHLKADNLGHKGASVTRNICYLKLHKLMQQQPHSLCFFVDSDETFQVKVSTPSGHEDRYALNYFYHYNQLFSTQNIDMVSAKYVGDPPVSPAVMADNFLQDVKAFLQQIKHLEPIKSCAYHQPYHSDSDHVAYHDMAGLFGCEGHKSSYDYRCELQRDHNNLACFNGFADGLKHFFYGEHLTRKTYYSHTPVINSMQPARTVYTGNYVFNEQGLKHFIPFAHLRLRMAGPTLGRLIQKALGDRFVSVNLPVLHQRILNQTGQAEFRHGVEADDEQIDLSAEFERQFFGDIMLFSVIELANEVSFYDTLDVARVEQIYQQTEDRMLALYEEKHQSILLKSQQIEALLNNKQAWWQQLDEAAEAVKKWQTFLANIALNFSDQAQGYQLITSASHRLQRKQTILNALNCLKNDQQTWNELLQSL